MNVGNGMYTIQGVLADNRISATDKLVAIALLECGQREMRLTNKEIAAMISSVETVVSRSLKSLVEFGYISTTIENNSKRLITTLDKNANPLNNKSTPLIKNARVSIKNSAAPLTKTQTPLAKTQGYLQIPLDKKLNPLVKLLTPLSKNANPLSKNARVFKLVSFVNQDFIGCCAYEFEKTGAKNAPIYIYYIKFLIELKGKVVLDRKGCGEKQKSKPFDITFDQREVATCQVLRQSCLDYNARHPGLYSPEMYAKFILHFSKLKNGKPAWYRELTRAKGTWDLPGRLAFWNSRDKEYSNNTSNGKSNQRSGGTLRPTSIAEPSKRTGAGNVAHVEF